MLREFAGWKNLLVMVALLAAGGPDVSFAQIQPPPGSAPNRVPGPANQAPRGNYVPAPGVAGQPSQQPVRQANQPQVGQFQPAPPTVPTKRQGVPLPEKKDHAPFQLSPEQFNAMVGVLKAWEVEGSKVQSFAAKVTVWENNVAFNQQVVLQGNIMYQSPDSGLYEVETKDGSRAQKWVCNGKSVFEFSYETKQLKEYQLPPEMQGKAISQSPLPFVFGAKVDDLLDRYFMRVVTPQNAAQAQVWLEAWPRHQAQRASFTRATIILQREDLMPFAVEFYLPDGNRNVLQFSEVQVNRGNNPIAALLMGNPFNPRTPFGWQRVVETPGDPQQQAGGPPAGPQPPPPRNANRVAQPPQ